ncbi:hypothetical protein E2320_009273, partial [Naja naja]
AEAFFRTRIDFSFFTHSVPQFVEQIYGYLFSPRGHLDAQGTGPNLADWVQELSTPAERFAAAAPVGQETRHFLQLTEEEVDELRLQAQMFLGHLQKELHQDVFPDVEPKGEAPMVQTLGLNDSLVSETHETTWIPWKKRRINCPVRLRSVRETYRWILQVPQQDLTMNFQKNAKGLYRAHIQAIVGQKAASFPGLVGLEQDSLYRSMPEIIALALGTLKV